jgi:hypothetical protein
MQRSVAVILSLAMIALGSSRKEVYAAQTTKPQTPGQTYDLVVYGGTSAAVTAALVAKRMGKTAIIVCPEKHLGGLSAGGLGWTDSGNKAVIGGVSREFYQLLKKYYDKPEAWVHQKPSDYKRYRPGDDAIWVFEPHVAEATFEFWVKQAQIPVHRDRWLDRKNGVKKQGNRIVSIKTLDGSVYKGRIFIDATYEGDLLAAAGISYHVGRESNSQYGETLNGVQTRNAGSHQFKKGIDPYVVPGDPSSGLLPRIHPGGPGAEGQGDHRIQAYNYRLCMTNVAANRVPFAKPAGYDAKQYELLLRTLLAGSTHVFGKFDPAPNGKTDTNNHGSFSTDNIGMNYEYPDGSYELRKNILKEHELYQKGFYYFLTTDPRVPERVRSRMNQWGLAKDEFKDNGHWPHQIYVREARRMISDFVMTELHLKGIKPTPKPIGMGSYNMDSHNTQRYVAKDKTGKAYVRNEGDIQVSPGGSYPISYSAIVPKKDQCDNLLVPVCLSSSHMAYGSIRMEPVFMILGESAATAAVIAVNENIAVQDVDYDKLAEKLITNKQVLSYKRTRKTSGRKGTKAGVDAKTLKGIVVDDDQAKRNSTWLESTSIGGYVGKYYLHDSNQSKGSRSVEFKTVLKKAGNYEVRLSYTANVNRASNVPVTIEYSNGVTTTIINQKKTPPIDGMWISLGKYKFAADEPVRVVISNKGTNGFVVVDAIQWLVSP